MSTYVLIPGAGGVAWFWHRVSPLLEAAGHTAIAVDLPGDDEAKGLPEYADMIVAAAAGRDDLVLVAQSMGGFCALPACERLPVTRLVLLNAMIPVPGETAGDWWGNTGSQAARAAAARRHGYAEEFELYTYFLHDVPADVAAAGEPYQRNEADIGFAQPCEFTRWPEHTTVLAGRDDRFFPVEFQQRLARERVGVEAEVVPGGHLAALSEPQALTAALLRL